MNFCLIWSLVAHIHLTLVATVTGGQDGTAIC